MCGLYFQAHAAFHASSDVDETQSLHVEPFRDERRLRIFMEKRHRVSTNGMGFCSFPTCAPQVSPSISATPALVSSPPDEDVPTSIVPLLMNFYDLVVNDKILFGTYCNFWLCSSAHAKRNGRSREIFPLPLMAYYKLGATCKIDPSAVLKVCNLGILALNFL